MSADRSPVVVCTAEADPLNVLRWAPNQGRYSPLWDVHPAAWAGPAGPVQRDWNDVEGLVAKGRIEE